MSFLYAVHDSYHPGCNDGDVDDRASIQLYDKYLFEHPEVKSIVVYLVGKGRYEKATTTMDNQINKGKRIIYEKEFNPETVKSAEKIVICAPIQDDAIRKVLTECILEKKNGYCQGDKIGVNNFPKPEYKELLDAIPEENRFSTSTTSLTFPSILLNFLDPFYKDEYMSYGLLKLIAIGGIIHLPALIYRLYCPEIGGGPGTNMLKIQEIIQKYFIPKMKSNEKTKRLNDLIVFKGNFEEFNSLLIEIVSTEEIYYTANMNVVSEFISIFKEKLPTANFKAMEEALKVMIYFSRIIYQPFEGELFGKDAKFYSLSEIPEGKLQIELDETPPLYDFVVSYMVLNGYNANSEVLSSNQMTRDTILAEFIPKENPFTSNDINKYITQK
jgi:hypothetical protein